MQQGYSQLEFSGDMPNRSSHLSKARHNEKLLISKMASSEYSNYKDWVATVAFYTALHYVDANLARYDIHPTSHRGRMGRNAAVSHHLRKVASKYLTLYARSRYARYVPYSERNLKSRDITKLVDWILKHFKTIT